MRTSTPSTVLIVDDEPHNLDVLNTCLRESSFRVLVATDGEQAIRRVSRIKPDLILLDVNLPGIDGFETCRRLKATDAAKDVPIIFITVDTDVVTKVKGLETGAVDYITKPFHPDEVVARVNTHLTINKLQQQLAEQNARLEQEIVERKQVEEALAAKREALAAEREVQQKLAHDLGERVKELNCLYGISHLVETPDISLEEIFEGTVDLIPPAWQYPAVTCARIIHEGREFSTTNLQETIWKQAAGIVVSGERVGVVEVCYREEKPERDEGPFLKEERRLLNGIAERLGRIIERKLAEEALAETNQLLETILDHTHMLVAYMDAQFNFARVNRAYAEADDKEPSFFPGKNHFDLYPNAENEAIFRRVVETGEPHFTFAKPFEYVEHPERGTSHWDWSLIPITGPRGTVIDLVLTLADVTERVQAEEALRESEERFSFFMENLPGIAYINSPEGSAVFGNKRLCEFYGRTLEEYAGVKFKELAGPERAAQIIEQDRQVLLAGNAIEIEEMTPDSSGPRHWLTYKFPIHRQGRMPLIGGLSIEITERKRGEQALRESNHRLEETLTKLRDAQEQMIRQERLAAVGQLSAGIAHDFRTLLTTIILYAQLSSRQPGLSPKLARNLETIIGESKKAADLVQQILDFSSRSMLRVQVLDLQSIVQDMMAILKRTIPKNVRLSLEVRAGEQPAAFTVRVDSGRIQQALINLAANARDAMPGGGKLCFALSRVEVAAGETPPLADMPPLSSPPVGGIEEGAWVCLAVSDTGTGMTEEVRDHLFEPFFTTKDVDKGTGLGLAQVYGIVRQHEGYIGAETELGQGTSFFIYLPAYEEQVQETKAKESSTLPQGQGEVVLLVEDNEDLRKAGQSILESLGYRVLTAANGREALSIYKEGDSVNLVITDVVMPEMGGKELVQELRRADPELKALAITGYAVEGIAQELREAGFLGVISKPFEVETLAQATHNAMSARAGRWI